MKPTKLTKAVLERLAPGERVFDTDTHGLIAHRGVKSTAFRIQADLWRDGRKVRTVKQTIGTFGVGPGLMTIDHARRLAQQRLGQIKSGVDPTKPQRSAAGVWTLAEALDQYEADAIQARGEGARTTINDMRRRIGKHLKDWLPMRLNEITPQACKERHRQILADVKARTAAKFEQREAEIRAGKNAKPLRPPTSTTGAKTANATMADLRAIFTMASNVFPTELVNPIRRGVIKFAREAKAHRFLLPEQYPAWAAAVGEISNPIRRHMHWVLRLTGARSQNVKNMRVEWLDLPGRVCRIPAEEMKARRPFDLPLNTHAVEHIQAALEAGRLLHPGDHGWVFPSRAPDGARIIATATVREKSWPATYQGHANRHDFSNVCLALGIDSDTRQLLLAQRVGSGVASVYVSPDALFARLLEASERVAAEILRLTAVRPLPEAIRNQELRESTSGPGV